jgi:hypothetical protein
MMFVVLAGMGATGFCQDEMAPAEGLLTPALEIDFSKAVSTAMPAKGIKLIDDLCKKFSEKMLRGHGPNGVGPFESASCLPLNGVSKDNNRAQTWQLVAERTDNGANLKFSLYFGTDVKIYELVLNTDLGLEKILGSPRISSSLAIYLSESMPFRSLTSLERLKKSSAVVTATATNNKGCAKPPEALVLYTLDYRNSMWRRTILATSQKGLPSQNRTTYKFDLGNLDTKGRSDKSPLFLHADTAQKGNLETLKKCMVNEVAELTKKSYSLALSVYVGFRYGMPIPKGAYAFNQSAFYGVFGEFRSGILKGLKTNYDWAPIQIKKDDTGTTTYSFSRISIGTSFSKAMNAGIFNYVDITPRLGVTNLTLMYAPEAGSEESGYQFRQFRAPTLGVELGLEKRHSFGLFRLWNFASYSVGVIPIDKNYATKAFKIGLDGFFNAIKMGPINLGILFFGVFDYTSITSKTEGSANAVTGNLNKISIANSYLGSGLTLNW